MKIVLVVLMLLCISGCNSANKVEVDESIDNSKVDYINVLCEDLEIEIMNYENGDITKEELISSIHLAQTDCDENRTICNTLKENIQEEISDKDLIEYTKKIEKSCYGD